MTPPTNTDRVSRFTAVINDLYAAVPLALSAVGISGGLKTDAAKGSTQLDSASVTAVVPIQSESVCVYVFVRSNNIGELATSTDTDAKEVHDLLGELANVLAGMVASGPGFSLGLPLVFQGPCLSGLSQESSLFSAGSALVQVGILS